MNAILSYQITLLNTLTLPKSTAAFTTSLYEGTLPDYTAEAWGASNFFVGGFGLLPHSLTTWLHGGRGKQTTMPTAASLHTLQVTWSSYSLERAMEILLQDFTGARMLANCTVTFSFWLQDCTGTDTHTHTHTRARALPKNLRRLFFTTSLTRVTHTTKLHGGGGRGSNHPDYGCFFPPPPKTDYLKYYITAVHLSDVCLRICEIFEADINL